MTYEEVLANADPRPWINDNPNAANGELIRIAVNAHEALVKALAECHRYFRNRPGNEQIQLSEICGFALTLARGERPESRPQ